jgi:hypothetical protein
MAQRNAIGRVNSKNVGRIKTSSLPTWVSGMPRVTISSTNFKILAIRRMKVKVSSPSKNGGRISERR